MAGDHMNVMVRLGRVDGSDRIARPDQMPASARAPGRRAGTSLDVMSDWGVSQHGPIEQTSSTVVVHSSMGGSRMASAAASIQISK